MSVVVWAVAVVVVLGGLWGLTLKCAESEDDGEGLTFLIMAVAAAATALRWLSETLAL